MDGIRKRCRCYHGDETLTLQREDVFPMKSSKLMIAMSFAAAMAWANVGSGEQPGADPGALGDEPTEFTQDQHGDEADGDSSPEGDGELDEFRHLGWCGWRCNDGSLQTAGWTTCHECRHLALCRDYGGALRIRWEGRIIWPTGGC
jgi:hypothetical protein